MKKPVNAPHINDIFKIDCSGLLSAHFDLYKMTDKKNRYLHWDKLRHLEPPVGVTNQEWWTLIKLCRQAQTKKLPLLAKNREGFNFCLPDSVQAHLHWLDMHAAGTIQSNEPITNPQIRNTYLIKSLVEESITSSQLEGAATTKKVAKEMIRKGRMPKDKNEQMIYNNYNAMRFIQEMKGEKLTPSIVFELHRILTEKTLDNPKKAGVFRTDSDDIHVIDRTTTKILHTPPKAEQLDLRMKIMCEFANRDMNADYFMHPVIKSILLHYILAYDHPFVDGNGRTARALFYWSMISQGYWLTEFISISRIIKAAPAQYEKAFLYTETDNEDVTYFIIHQLEVIRKAIDDLHIYLENKSKLIEEASESLRKAKNLKLNFRQLALLRHALKHPRFVYTIKEHMNSHGINPQTSRKDLLQMADMKLLTKLKHGKSFVFLSPDGLEERIKAEGVQRRKKAR